MNRVSLLKCDSYDAKKIESKIRYGFELLGGEEYIRSIIPQNSSIMLKPNLLSIERVGSPVVTNDVFFEGVIRVLKDYSSNIKFGDSPGFGDSRRAAEKCGLINVANKYGVEFVPFKEEVHVTLEKAIRCTSWNVSKEAYESDVLITLPKMKTHAMAYFTGAIKNQFGCIVGTKKASWHTRMPEANNFSKMLLDLNSVLGTDYAIMDGIVAMQGNGPKNGEPYNMNSIIMGKSLSAVDSIAAYLMGYKDPLETPILKEVHDSKWGPVLIEDIKVLGEDLESMSVDDFELCRKGGNFYFINPSVTNFLRGMIAPYPSLIKEKCIKCKRCVDVCPETPKAVLMKKNNKNEVWPVWDMKQCIRCFCCQELCPVGAIETRKTTLGRLLNGGDK
ncbi:DUF362 domain-containing protein [Oceanirhabdus sp. W0125-5]|uniref:DUF362 domain-containing protein n=1 Tax=Oceanirhabdus sp. W0125-5 TaxID=2999116 RepID=UPI0022F32A9C|nr:DUF362 domain-containing protein [Oceanirhabdus sp. W0125-5]WBW97598.1 DUF362 domain-containing protein [Oceanirhabdus sp. W0125-5]